MPDYELTQPQRFRNQGGLKFKEPIPKGLTTYLVEIEYGGTWVNLNDHLNYKVGAASQDNTQVTWRKIMAESPVVEGSYLIHATRGLVMEKLQIYVYGADQWGMNENTAKLEELFGRLEYRIRLTFDDYREYWRCQTADYAMTRSQVMVHNVMNIFDATVPRFPTVEREVLV